MENVNPVVEALNAPEAKRRERMIQALSKEQLQNAQVIETLQKLVSSDPVEYVRDAARAALVSAGQTPAASVVRVQLVQEGNAKAAGYAIGCTLAPLLLCAIVLIVLLVIFGPAISNAVSR